MNKSLVVLVFVVSTLVMITVVQGSQEKCVGPYAIPTVTATPTATASLTPTATSTP